MCSNQYHDDVVKLIAQTYVNREIRDPGSANEIEEKIVALGGCPSHSPPSSATRVHHQATLKTLRIPSLSSEDKALTS
jgi:hypothetical protein